MKYKKWDVFKKNYNEFTAFNYEKGYIVFGDFEGTVYATSEEAYNEFIKLYPPNEWDYWDI